MPFSRPTLPALITRIFASIRSRLNSEQMRRSDAEVYGKALAGTSHELFGYIDGVAKNLMYDTCDEEYLRRYASIWKKPQKPAEKASGSVTLYGANGSVILVGRTLIYGDGIEYTTTEEGVITAGVAVVPLTAVLPGAAGNLAAGSSLTLGSPVPGVMSDAIVTAAGLTNGSDIEEIEDWRARFLARISQPPHGGADYDYVAWALEVPGVTRAWVYPNALGLGTVTVRFVRDDDDNLIPDDAEVAVVQAHIDSVRPVTSAVTVLKPIADPLAFTFTSVTPNNAQVKAAITAELLDLLTRESEPGGTVYLSHIREAISIAAGENNYVMTAPAADIVSPTGHMATLGVITWP